jgi:hypothetical protein
VVLRLASLCSSLLHAIHLQRPREPVTSTPYNKNGYAASGSSFCGIRHPDTLLLTTLSSYIVYVYIYLDYIALHTW